MMESNDMDELINGVNKAWNYVNFVQCACDQQRALLEQAFNREYKHYIKEWNQKEATKEVKEKDSENVKTKEAKEKDSESIEAVQEDFRILELEELALADNLLRKARRIREKFKMPYSDEDLVNSGVVDTAKLSNGNEQNPLLHEFYVKTMKQSASLPVMNPTKTCIPNAAISHKPLREQRIMSNDSISTRRIPPPKVLTSTHRAVLPKSKLNSYKELCCAKSSIQTIPQYKNRTEAEFSSKAKSILGNVAEKPRGGNKSSNMHLQAAPKKSVKLPISSLQEKRQPTYKEFLKLSQGSRHPNFMRSFWYPFLNSTNTERLIANITFTSAKELQQIYILLLNIQETVFWLDLFSILGKDVTPHLNKRQRDGAVMCSYIQSIFHPKLRRKPMIVESSFNS